MGNSPAIIDLRKAYLQLNEVETLWPCQTVMFKSKRYCLTRLGFGFNVAKMIIKSVSAIVEQDDNVKKGVLIYVDNIFVDENVVNMEYVRKHFSIYGLKSKDGERIDGSGVRVFGLTAKKVGGKLMWLRDNWLEEIPRKLSRRAVFPICGQFVSHLPVCGWLRVVCSIIERKVVSLTSGWNDEVHNMGLWCVLKEVLKRVEENDPAHGEWEVHGDEGKVWVDASSLALGALVQIGGVTFEDATWLRKGRSEVHINMAELDAVQRGVNIAFAWKLNKLQLFTDYVTVFHWISVAVTGKSRLRSKDSAELLIRRSVNLFRVLIDDYNLDVNVNLISSKENLIDSIARIPGGWMRMLKLNDVTNCAGMALTDGKSILEIPRRTGHFGVRRTLHFVRKKFPTVLKEDVQKVIWESEKCQMIVRHPLRGLTGN